MNEFGWQFRWWSRFRRWTCARLAVFAHIVGMLLAPLLLTVATLRAIQRIILELPAMKSGAPMALAIRLAANSLIRVITGRFERLSTIRATGKRHVHQSNSLLLASPATASAGPQSQRHRPEPPRLVLRELGYSSPQFQWADSQVHIVITLVYQCYQGCFGIPG